MLGLGKLGSNTIILSIGMGCRSIAQLVIFFIVARTLGVDYFGQFVAVLALANALSCLSGLGVNVLLVRDVSCNHECFAQSWGLALRALLFSAPPVFIIYLGLAFAILPNDIFWQVIILIGGAEILLAPLANSGVYIYQAHEKMMMVAIIQFIPTFIRFLLSLVFFFYVHLYPSIHVLKIWATLYFLSTLTAALYIQHKILFDFGKPVFKKKELLTSYIRNSVAFSVSSLSDKLYSDADKFMLARMASSSTAGIYSVGHRFVDLATMPLQALMSTLAPRYFQIGATGLKETIKYTINIAKFPVSYAAIVCMAIWYFSPLITFLLGIEYSKAIESARWLSFLPLIISARYLLHYPLITSGFQNFGMQALICGSITNILLNFFLIPRWTLKGAIVATYASEFVMCFLILFFLLKNKDFKQLE